MILSPEEFRKKFEKYSQLSTNELLALILIHIEQIDDDTGYTAQVMHYIDKYMLHGDKPRGIPVNIQNEVAVTNPDDGFDRPVPLVTVHK